MKKFCKILLIIICILSCVCFVACDESCNQANTVRHNIQQDANKFDVYRKITFVNLYTGQLLYSAEGYFSVQSTYTNEYQGQQEVGLVFKVGGNQYKMDYFSIAENVCYVIEQIENTTGNPYHWKIVWYIPFPENVGG